MDFNIGNIVKIKGKLGVIIDISFMPPGTVRVSTFDNPQYWGDEYNKNDITFVMKGHPDIADQIRDLNSVNTCIDDYLSGNLNNRGKYNLLRYANINSKFKPGDGKNLEKEYEQYENLFNLLFNLRDIDMIKLWIDKNLPISQNRDDVFKGCKFLLSAITKSKVI